MKNFLIIIPVFLIFTLIFGFFFPLSTPQKAFTVDPTIDEAYFIHKLLEGNIQLLGENHFTITEEELNQYIHYKILREDSFLYTIPHLQLSQVHTILKEEKIILHGYGKLFYLPVKIQMDVIPEFYDHELQLVVDRLQLTRLTLPLKVIYSILAPYVELEKNSPHGKPYFSLPLTVPQEITIQAVQFKNGQLIIHYEIAKEKLIDQFMKNFFNF